MILLNDILNIADVEMMNTKIRFNKGHDDFDPVASFKSNKERLFEGHFWNAKQKSFRVGQTVIGFIALSDDKWLLFDISRITKDLNVYNGSGYEYQTVKEYSKYFGRLVISYKNKAQNLVRKAETVIDQCEVYEIISDVYEEDYFPGYDSINISWDKLKYVLEKKDWKAALKNQKGVYLITDTCTGKRYVGSAYGDNMIYARWKNYVDTCNGGNKDLKQLDSNYIRENFRYSLLEIYKSSVNDKDIIAREYYWMNVLMTRDKRFGYNN